MTNLEKDVAKRVLRELIVQSMRNNFWNLLEIAKELSYEALTVAAKKNILSPRKDFVQFLLTWAADIDSGKIS